MTEEELRLECLRLASMCNVGKAGVEEKDIVAEASRYWQFVVNDDLDPVPLPERAAA